MERKENYSFQVDSEIVKNIFQKQENYLIEYSEESPKEYCIIYFSSNDIYYPNSEHAFQEQLINKNPYEWYKTRINFGYKHIFLRDIQKQWYIGGVNSTLNTPEKLLSFLKKETEGYKIITIGSSAGGFASVIYGQLLVADRIFTFNGNFELSSKLKISNERICPLLFRNQENEEIRKWFDTRNIISNPSTIFYFHSTKSTTDIPQYAHVKDLSINCIQFKTSNHGVPFLKTNLSLVINSKASALLQLTGKVLNPLVFSLRNVGLIQTILALKSIFLFGMKKVMIKLRIMR
jgi:hypothetical protein